jgi:hypothetical protein
MRYKTLHKPSWQTAKAAKKLALTNQELLENRPSYAALKAHREYVQRGFIHGDYVRDVD